MSAIAIKVLLEAISRGTDKVPDKYWDRIPGMRPPKTEQEYKDTKAKVDANEAKYGRFGSDQRRHDDKDRNGRQMADRQRNHKHSSAGHDRHRARRRSQSDERRTDGRRDRGLRAERRTLERRASSYSPPPSEDEDFYNDVEMRRQAGKSSSNHPSHQRWERRDQPAMTSDHPYLPMPQQGGPIPASYQQVPPLGTAGTTVPQSGAPSYHPAYPMSAQPNYQATIPPHPQGGASRPPVSFTQYHSPPNSQRSSLHSSTTSFSPQSSSPYTPVSATSSRRSSSQLNGHSLPQDSGAQKETYVRVSPTALPQQVSAGLESKAAQKYTPPGVVTGNDL